jgi:hypothetical protein
MWPHDISKNTFERPSSAVIAVEAAIDFSTCTVCTTCPGAAILRAEIPPPAPPKRSQSG